MPKNKKKGGKKGNQSFDVGPLTRKGFRREERAAERQQFRPISRQMTREAKASRFRMNKETPAWFKGYQADLAKLRGESQGASDAALDRIQAFSGQAGTQDAANRDAIMERLQKDAQLRGTTVDPNVDVGQANAESARQSAMVPTLGALAGQGANQFSYLTNRIGIAGQASRESQQKELARLLGIQRDRRELARERGDFRTTYRKDAKESERKYGLELAAVAGDKAYNKAIIRQAQLGVKEKGTPSTHTNINKGGSKDKDKGGISAGEATGFARAGEPKKGWQSKQDIFSYLVNRGVSDAVAKKVASRIWSKQHGYVQPPSAPGGGR